MPLIFQKRIYREDLQANPKITYVFGDNEKHVGMGGQAGEMRGEPNALGIPTKKAPGTANDDYWSDDNFDHNRKVIDTHMSTLDAILCAGKTVVFPLDGIGTGLSDLPNKAPKTYAYLENYVNLLKRFFSL